MPLVSIKRYLGEQEDQAVLRKVIALLLQGMADHAVCTDHLDFEQFKDRMKGFIAGLETGHEVSHYLVLAGSVVQALEDYNQRAIRGLRLQGVEMQNMIAMLTQAVITISGSSDRSAVALSQIKKDLERAGAVEDIQAVRMRLGECLEKVRAEVTRQRVESESLVLELRQSIMRAQDSALAISPGNDPVTGLPSQAAAKAAFADALRSGQRAYVVTLVTDRLQALNARFGKEMGDQVLREMRKHIESSIIREGDLLFRWGGPTFVAVLYRTDLIDHVRAGLRRVFDSRTDTSLDLGGRSVLIPLALAWTVMALIPPVSNIPTFIDRFVASQGTRDYC